MQLQTALDFERVDATRLAAQYRKVRGLSGTDIVGWLIGQAKDNIEAYVRGNDNRRLDYDLFKMVDNLKRA